MEQGQDWPKPGTSVRDPLAIFPRVKRYHIFVDRITFFLLTSQEEEGWPITHNRAISQTPAAMSKILHRAALRNRACGMM